MKAGTKVATKGFAPMGVPPETGVVMRWHSPTNGNRADVPGYQKVRFDADGAVLLVHESNLVIQ
jgi:hypothetical protein